MRTLRWHATSARNDHGQGKYRRALKPDLDALSFPGEALPCISRALRARAGREVWLHGARDIVLLSLVLILTIMGGRPDAQTPPQDNLPALTPSIAGPDEPALTPAVPGPLEIVPPPQERLLAPVPPQFNWLQREAPSNPLLEALLSVQGPARLVVTTSLTEEVSDNFAHSPGNRRIDSRTGIALGTVYRLDDGQKFVSLANTVRAFYETGTDRVRFGFANLALNAGYQLPPLTFGLTESFIRDDTTAQSATTPLLTAQQNFIRNSISPQVRYDISPLTAATLGYTNTLVIDEDSNDTSISHAVTPGISHQFSPNLTGDARYTFTTSDGAATGTGTGTGGSESTAHRIAANLGYQLDTETSATLGVFGRLVDRRGMGERDSRTYGASIGVRRTLFSTVSLFASIGPTVFKRQGEGEKLRANYQLNLDGPIPLFATPTLVLTLTTRQSIQDTVGEVNDVGLVLRQDVEARLTYTPMAFFTAALFVTYSRNELLEDVNTGTTGGGQGRTDNLSSTGVTASYALTSTISLTGTYRYQRRDSNRSENNFEENRVTVAVTSTFPIF